MDSSVGRLQSQQTTSACPVRSAGAVVAKLGPTAMRIASLPVSGIHRGPFLRTQRRRHGITPGAAPDAMPGRGRDGRGW
jgi:hypothetical protein